jgi:Protein of unknown function (DUF3987)
MIEELPINKETQDGNPRSLEIENSLSVSSASSVNKFTEIEKGVIPMNNYIMDHSTETVNTGSAKPVTFRLSVNPKPITGTDKKRNAALPEFTQGYRYQEVNVEQLAGLVIQGHSISVAEYTPASAEYLAKSKQKIRFPGGYKSKEFEIKGNSVILDSDEGMTVDEFMEKPFSVHCGLIYSSPSHLKTTDDEGKLIPRFRAVFPSAVELEDLKLLHAGAEYLNAMYGRMDKSAPHSGRGFFGNAGGEVFHLNPNACLPVEFWDEVREWVAAAREDDARIEREAVIAEQRRRAAIREANGYNEDEGKLGWVKANIDPIWEEIPQCYEMVEHLESGGSAGGWFLYRNPFSSTQSSLTGLHVHEKTGVFKDHATGEKGNAQQFAALRLMGNKHLVGAEWTEFYQRVAEIYGITFPQHLLDNTRDPEETLRELREPLRQTLDAGMEIDAEQTEALLEGFAGGVVMMELNYEKKDLLPDQAWADAIKSALVELEPLTPFPIEEIESKYAEQKLSFWGLDDAEVAEVKDGKAPTPELTHKDYADQIRSLARLSLDGFDELRAVSKIAKESRVPERTLHEMLRVAKEQNQQEAAALVAKAGIAEILRASQYQLNLAEVYPLILGRALYKAAYYDRVDPSRLLLNLKPICGILLGSKVRLMTEKAADPKDAENKAQCANQFVADVAAASTGKGLALDRTVSPMKKLQGELNEYHINLIETLTGWMGNNEKGSPEHEAAKKELSRLGDMPPKLKVGSNETIQSVTRMGAILPAMSGFGFLCGELKGVFDGWNMFSGKGNDRQIVLEAWDKPISDPIVRSKAAGGTIYPLAQTISLSGGIQPEFFFGRIMLDSGDSDGMAARFWLDLPIIPANFAEERDIDDVDDSGLYSILEGLYSYLWSVNNTQQSPLPTPEPKKTEPVYMKFSREAQKIYNKLSSDCKQRFLDTQDTDKVFAQYVNRYAQKVARDALAHHFIFCYFAGVSAKEAVKLDVSADTLMRVIQIDTLFLNRGRLIFATLGHSSKNAGDVTPGQIEGKAKTLYDYLLRRYQASKLQNGETSVNQIVAAFNGKAGKPKLDSKATRTLLQTFQDLNLGTLKQSVFSLAAASAQADLENASSVIFDLEKAGISETIAPVAVDSKDTVTVPTERSNEYRRGHWVYLDPKGLEGIVAADIDWQWEILDLTDEKVKIACNENDRKVYWVSREYVIKNILDD